MKDNPIKICAKVVVINTIKIYRKIKEKIKAYAYFIKLKDKACKIRKEYDKCVFIVATPCHENLGDHAIVYAEYQLLLDCGFENQIIEITNIEYRKYKKLIKKCVKNQDIIIIDGGGSLGTLWPKEDDKITEIIDTYKNNKIIVFPQTCFYDNSTEGKERLIRNKKAYQNAKGLVISLRDKASYDFCLETFGGVKLEFVPDIVLSTVKNIDVIRQDKCMLCFREDIEKVVSDRDIEKIYAHLENNEIEFEKISTIYRRNVSKEERIEKVENLWKKLSGAKLLLTDRLHGMIFATITGTPCIALDNKSKKVSGVYRWISDLGYVKLCSSADEMIGNITEFYNMSGTRYSKDLLDAEYDKLRKYLY